MKVETQKHGGCVGRYFIIGEKQVYITNRLWSDNEHTQVYMFYCWPYIAYFVHNLQLTIMNALEQDVCPLLGALSGECKSLIEQYGPVLFNVLTNWVSMWADKIVALIIL